MPGTQFPPYFAVEVETCGTYHIAHLCGELDIASSDALGELLEALSTPVVVVDLAGVTFIDSTGFGTLVRARRHLQCRGVNLVAQGPLKPNVSQVFDVLGALGEIRSTWSAIGPVDPLSDPTRARVGQGRSVLDGRHIPVNWSR